MSETLQASAETRQFVTFLVGGEAFCGGHGPRTGDNSPA